MLPGGRGRSRGKWGQLGGWGNPGWGVGERGRAGEGSRWRITAQRRWPWTLTVVIGVLLFPFRWGGAETSLHVIDVLVQEREDRLWLWFPKLLLQSEGLDR